MNAILKRQGERIEEWNNGVDTYFQNEDTRKFYLQEWERQGIVSHVEEKELFCFQVTCPSKEAEDEVHALEIDAKTNWPLNNVRVYTMILVN